jgi:hypothetical protein
VDAVGAAARDDEVEGFLNTIDRGSFSGFHATALEASEVFGWFGEDGLSPCRLDYRFRCLARDVSMLMVNKEDDVHSTKCCGLSIAALSWGVPCPNRRFGARESGIKPSLLIRLDVATSV